MGHFLPVVVLPMRLRRAAGRHIPLPGPMWVHWWRWLGICTVLLMSPVQAMDSLPNEPASPELLQVQTLVRAHVLELAESLLEQQGPPQVPDGAWLNWERQLWALYRVRGQWQALLERIQTIPPAFPASIVNEAQREAVRAYLALGEGHHARRILRQQLFSIAHSAWEQADLRQQIIQSYLVDGRFTDAMTAVQVFQLDYRPQDRAWLQLAGNAALQSGNPSEAIRLLAPLDDPWARVLTLRARLQEGEAAFAELMQRGEQMLQDEAYRPLQKPLLAVMVEIAGAQGALRQKVDFLEQYLLATESPDADVGLGIPRFGVDDLVRSYADLEDHWPEWAEPESSARPRWEQQKLRLQEADDLIRRSLWTGFLLDNLDMNSRQQAISQWVMAAISTDRWQLVPLLFGPGTPLGALHLTPRVGLDLSYKALAAGDYGLAARANAHVSSPPESVNVIDWWLYTARISITAGDYEDGIKRLRESILLPATLSPEYMDKALQVVFILQEADQHASAVALLALMETQSPGGKYDREIPFWQAQSHEEMGQYREAAYRYLLSALQKDSGYDEWGRSARFRAADVLRAGHFFGDARALVKDLLMRTDEPMRVAGLNQKLEQIWREEASLTGLGHEVGEP